MTIKTRLLRIAAFLVSLLTVIRGRLLYYVVRYGSVEYSAQIATGSIQSSSKVITPLVLSSPASVGSLKNLSSEYDGPDAMLHDILVGKISCDKVSLSEWIELNAMAMIGGHQPHLNLDVPYGGGVYSFHHCIKKISPPTPVAPILEQRH